MKHGFYEQNGVRQQRQPQKKIYCYSPLPLLFLVRYRHERFQHPIPFFEVSKNISTKHHLMFSTPNLRNVIQNWMEVEHLNKKKVKSQNYLFFYFKFYEELPHTYS